MSLRNRASLPALPGAGIGAGFAGLGVDGAEIGSSAALESRVAALETGQGRQRRRELVGAKISAEVAEVIAALRQLGGRGQARQIAALMRVTRRSSTFDMRLARMVRRGLVRRPHYGVYELSGDDESRPESL
jgi:hypothetical protein